MTLPVVLDTRHDVPPLTAEAVVLEIDENYMLSQSAPCDTPRRPRQQSVALPIALGRAGWEVVNDECALKLKIVLLLHREKLQVKFLSRPLS